MRRQLWMCIVASAFVGLAGCVVESGEPSVEDLGETRAALGEASPGGVATPNDGMAAGRPRSMIVSSDDPSGPTPYPWQSSDPSGPTPYPWDDEDDDPTDDEAQPSDSTSGSSAHTATTKTSKK